MTAPQVTVVIPVYNRPDYLTEALASLATQTHPRVQVIVVDDGSTDDIAAVVATFNDVVYLRQEQAGPSVARNLGIQHATGQYFAFLDSDDRWLPEKIACQVECAVANPETDLVYTRAVNFLEEGHACPPHMSDADFGVSIPCIMTMLVKAESFRRVGDFAPHLKHGEDTDWVLRARDAGLTEHTIDEPLLQRRIHGDNLSSNITQSRQNALEILRESIRRKRAQQEGDS
ncbi:MAG: glycosyltransferase family A protein [Planctomycetota bacterium]